MGKRRVSRMPRQAPTAGKGHAALWRRLQCENMLLRRAVAGASVSALARSLLRVVDGMLPGCPCEVLVRASASGYLEVVGTRGFRPDRGHGCRIPLGLGVTGVAAQTGRTVWVRDVAQASRYIPGVVGARWELAVPLCHRGDTLGVVDLESAGHPPTLRQRRHVQRLAAVLAPAFDRALASRHVAPLRLRTRTGAVEAPAVPPPPPAAPAVRFQPIHDLAQRRVLGYEASVGVIPYVTEAPRQAAQVAAEDLARLRAALEAWRGDHGLLFLDIHPASLGRAGFAAAVGEQLRRHGLPSSAIVLELPDPGQHGAIHRHVLATLAEYHFAVALDGFGAGAGDARALIEWRPAYVKLDRLLVRGIDRDFGRRTYIESLSYYTRRMGTSLIALEIATPAEVAALRRAGVTYGQGELLGPASPLPA